ncbi:stress response protein TerZ [Kitasatospora albolonga]|uniref:Stress response protein TerZ n=2 Tax=Kitasatosporales TaxID=85011 RepID=A0ABC8BRM0_9ACTN|nr:stress response protein TerZ [Kitasatospora albolonga]
MHLGGLVHEMVKGANVGLTALSDNVGSVVVGLGWSSATGEGDADVSVLLLDGDGKVRSDGDFCFYNNPVAGNGSVQLLGKTPTADGSEDRISFDLDAVPQEIDKVVVAASRYGGSRFGELDDLRLTLADSTGDGLVRFAVDGADEVSAVIFGELYRRSGEWKFRAVGQGYASGLAGLATDYGVDIDDTEEDAPEPADLAEDGRPQPDRPAPEPPRPEEPVEESPVSRVPAQATGPRVDDTPGPVPPAPEQSAAPKPARRPRTAKKKVTLPRTTRKSLADNESWRSARLFPVSALKSDRERETRATSVVLSVMAQVPEFGRRLTAGFGAPAGRMETFTEVTLPHGESPRRPDGVVRVERAGKLWTALVETKTNGNALKPDQVQAYMDIAARRGYEAVITLSNDVALEGSPLVDVRIDGRRKHKVALWHLSWAEVVHQAQMLIRHEGVGNAAHAWLLQELLAYLQHENSGCHGFQNMGAAWVPVRRGIDDETLCQGDARALEVIENWERLVRQVCLRLGGELGQKVLPVQRTRRGSDPRVRRTELADHLCEQGRLNAEIRIEGTPGVLAITADLRTAKLRTSIEIPAAEPGYPLSRVKRLIRRLAEAPADLHIETLVDGQSPGPRGTLERLRPEPADIVPKDGAQITGFRLSLFKGMGNGRGSAETGFIRSVDQAVDRFHAQVVAQVQAPAPRRSRSEEPVG